MRNSIKICLIAFAAIIFTGSLFAQRDKKDFTPEDRATKKTERLTETLNLDAAQAEKIKAIHLKYGERMHALRAQDTTDKDQSQKKAAMQQIRTEIDAEIKTVLTTDQYQKFQEMPKRGHHKGKKGRGHDNKRNAFHQEKIKPIMLEQRAKLESKITAEDKATLAQLRTDIEKDKAEHKAKREEYNKSSDKKERPDREQMENRKAESKNNPNRTKLIALAEKYKADIEPLFAEVEPQIKALKEEMKKECGEKGQGNHQERGARCDKGKKEMKGQDENANFEKRENRKYAHFLLLDPNKEVKAKKRQGKSDTSISNVKVYPNPSQGISKIEYELKTPETITIELHDKEGNLVETIERAEKATGNHEATINFSKYTVGVYYVVLKDAKGTIISKKVVR
jgi:periplasmic protein CpxP/Spy